MSLNLECLICLSRVPDIAVESDNKLELELSECIIFTLKHVLEVPLTLQERYLQIRATQENVIRLCDFCKNGLKSVKKIFDDLQLVLEKYEKAKIEIQEVIRRTSIPKNGEQWEVGGNGLAKECRAMVCDRLQSRSRAIGSRLSNKKPEPDIILIGSEEEEENPNEIKVGIDPNNYPLDESNSDLAQTTFSNETETREVREEGLAKECRVMVCKRLTSTPTKVASPLEDEQFVNLPEGVESAETEKVKIELQFFGSESEKDEDQISMGSPSHPDHSDPLDSDPDYVKEEDDYPTSDEDEDSETQTREQTQPATDTAKKTNVDIKNVLSSFYCPVYTPPPKIVYEFRKPSFSCNLCSKGDLNFATFLQHIHYVHQQIYKCVKCPETSNTTKGMEAHWCENHGDLDMEIPTEWERVKPTLPELPWWCPMCLNRFMKKRSRDSHFKKCYPTSTSESNSSFETRPSRNTNCKVPNCSKSYFCEEELTLHMVFSHPDVFIPTAPPKPTSSNKLVDRSKYMFTCETCGKKYSTANSLGSHISLFHKNPRKIPCSICGKTCKDRSSFEIHSYVKHGIPSETALKHEKQKQISKEKVICDVCGKEIPKHRLNAHLVLVHQASESDLNVKFYECETCEKRFLTPSSLAYHKLVCLKTKAFLECDLCQAKFSGYADLRSHKKFKHSIEIEDEKKESETSKPAVRIKCPQCDKEFEHASVFKNHSKRHKAKPESECECTICGSKFRSKNGLAHHMAAQHGIGKPRLHRCITCNKTFPKQMALMKHICERTPNSTIYSCSHCGEEFASKSRRDSHVRLVHEKALEKCCEHCGYVTTKGTNFLSHLAHKHQIGDFKCTEEGCSKVFHSQKNLDDHREIHTPNGKVKDKICPHCGKAFNKNNIRGHIRAMHTNREAKPYKCEICGKIFATLTSLSGHRKIHKEKKNT